MIQLRLQPDMEAQLAEEARERGLPLDLYIEKIVEARAFVRQAREAELREAVQKMMDFAEKNGATLGGLSLKEMMHEGHKY
jgi:beta-lactamase class A